MTYKSRTQPFCRWCGKPIAKATHSHRVPKSSFKFEDNDRIVTLDDLKKLTNEQVVSVKYHYEKEEYERLNPGEIYDTKYKRHVSGRRTIYAYSTWDGESYVDEFFCNGDHARSLGYLAARKGYGMQAWHNRQEQKKKAAGEQ